MAKVSEIITDIRIELDDSDSSRFETDIPILSMVKKALRRVENICIRKGLDFAKSHEDLTLLSGDYTVALPSDFKRDIGLFCNRSEIKKVPVDYFEKCSSGSIWIINGTNIQFKTAATSDTVYSFWYYPELSFSSYTVVSATTTNMPWADRLNDIIVEYASMRLKNIDEYDISMEEKFLAEMQEQILETYGPLTAVTQEMGGYSEI